LYENYPAAIKVKTKGDHALTTLEGGARIRSKFVVVATGGLFQEKSLSGIMKPCFSYLVSLKEPESSKDHEFRLPSPNSMNFFTWEFTHDWCLTKGNLRCSGEDHFSSLKPPRCEERCGNLAKWTATKYPYLKESEKNC